MVATTTIPGAGVDVYIIDTGVYIQHQEFGGRAIWGETFTNDGDVDCNGHGTHCGSTAAGTQYGVAKGANIIAVKVLGCSGSGTWDGVIGGVAWTADRYLATGRPSVASMSLGGAKNVAVDDAVDAAIEAGVSFVVAAGNDNNDACRTSPAGVAAAITVGATETTDVRSTFSAWGTCVDIFAPGTNVLGAWIGSPTASRIISGTSMATPHVTGAVARYLQTNPTATPAQVTAALIAEGTPNILNLRCTTTGCQRSPNLLLYARCAGQE
jgi:subtilisin family serine protease